MANQEQSKYLGTPFNRQDTNPHFSLDSPKSESPRLFLLQEPFTKRALLMFCARSRAIIETYAYMYIHMHVCEYQACSRASIHIGENSAHVCIYTYTHTSQRM